jgi:hypothetical protein
MATGDQNDIAARIASVLPNGWFPDQADAPTLWGILTGFGAVWAPIYSLLVWVQLQTRIKTATGANLDLISLDFFGNWLPRRTGESDTAFVARIEKELFRPKGTRAAVVQQLTDLTGQLPRIFEPRLTSDTGGYTIGGIGYGAGGGYGSLLLPFQFFVQAYFAVPSGIANVGGYYLGSGSAGGGYGAGAIEYGDLAEAPGLIADADIYAGINNVRPAATIAWVAISAAPVLPDPPGAPSGLGAS